MTVFHGILFILKWVGIFLLLAVGLILLFVVAALLVPVRYKGRVKKEELPENAVLADGLVSWLNPLVRVKIRFSEQRLRYTVRVFGLCLINSEKPKKEKKTKKKKKIKKKTKKTKKICEETKGKTEQVLKDSGGQHAGERAEETSGKGAAQPSEGKEEQRAAKKPKKSIPERIKEVLSKCGEWLRRGKTIPEWLREKLLRFRKEIELLWKKKNAAVAFLQEERHVLVVGKTLKTTGKLLRQLLPRRIKGHVEFGTGDPESTGKALAALGIFYAAHGRCLTIVPDFTEKRLAARVTFRGRIRLGTVLVMVLRFLKDKQVKAFHKDWKQFAALLKQKAE